MKEEEKDKKTVENVEAEMKFKTSKNEEKNKEVDKKKKEKSGNSKKKIIIPIIIVAVILIILLAILGYLLFRNKFKDASLELGQTEISVDDFLVSKIYKEKAEIVTNLEELDMSKVGELDVVVSYKGKEETVKLKIVDTTPPQVTFKDITEYTGYQIDPNDFIVEKSDLSEMTVETNTQIDTTEYKDHTVRIIVKDAYGNETSKDCILTISWIKTEVYIELGENFTKDHVIVNMEADRDKLPQSEIDKVNVKQIGEYEIEVEYNGVKYKSKIIVQDTTAPDLQLKEVSIYDDEKVKGKESFITSATDASGEVKTTMKTQIDYSKIGSQEVIIEAEDVNGNKVEKTTTLTIKRDTEGPVISGLTALTVQKHAKIDYNKGVKSSDARDGACEFTVDSSKVNVDAAGTYYATYTSKDKKGNTTTSKRKIVVNHDSADVQALVNQMASQCGNGVEQIRDFVRNKIRYSHSYGDGDPIWYGFTNWSGNCYVHAHCFQALLQKKGYTTRMIWVTNKTHYWNMVLINGKWKHMDSTPDSNHRKISIMNDAERLSTLSGRDWDRSAWPAAE